jgi:hypothetical protein
MILARNLKPDGDPRSFDKASIMHENAKIGFESSSERVNKSTL